MEKDLTLDMMLILAATNRPESLDPVLLRPGRFDRRVPVEIPDLKGREEILKVHARKIKLSEDADFGKIARMASGAPVQSWQTSLMKRRFVQSEMVVPSLDNRIWRKALRWSLPDIRRRMLS